MLDAMTTVGHARATGTVEFTDGTSAGRDSAAGSPLGQAVLTALRAAPLLDGRPWRWRLHDGVAELWADRVQPLGPADPMPVVVCGAALQQSRIALAAAGWESTVDRLPDPHQPGFVALLRRGGPRAARSADAQTYRAVLAGPGGHPAAALPHPAPPSTLYRLRDTAERSGAGLRLLGPGESGVLASLGTAADRRAGHAILYARSDSPRDWLLAGEALVALTVTAAGRTATAVPDGAPVAPAARRALAGLLPAGACPLLLLRVTAGPDPATPRERAAARAAAPATAPCP